MKEHRKLPSYHIRHLFSQPNLMQAIAAGGILIILFHIFVGPPLGVPTINLIKNTFMQIFGILLPGAALYVLLYPSRQNILGALFISYALGYAGNILSYFLLVPFGWQNAVPFFVILIAILSVWILWKQRDRFPLEQLQLTDLVCVLLFLLYLCLHTIVTVAVTAPPSITGTLSCHPDHLYWIENSISLAQKFPPADLRVAIDMVYRYHYFSSIQLAFSSLATGVDIYTLGSILFPIGQCLLFFGSFYVLFCSALKNRLLSIFGLIIICFCTGLEGLTMSYFTYVHHTWTSPFGFDIGFAFGALFLHVLSLQYYDKQFDLRTCILTVLMLLVTTGTKAPIAAVLIVAAGIICFSWLLKKQYCLAFSYGVALLAAFLIIAINLVGMLTPTVTDSSSTKLGSFSFTYFIAYSPITQAIQQATSSLPLWLKGFMLIGTALFCLHPLIISLYSLGSLSIFTDVRMRTPLCIALFCSGSLGLLLGLFNLQPGKSQIYFAMAAFIPCLFLGLIWLETAGSEWRFSGKWLTILLCGILLSAQVTFLLFESYTYPFGKGLLSPLHQGYNIFFAQETAQQNYTENSIQATDVDAMTWIRNNTSRDSILLSDRGVMGEYFAYMYYGVFSERQMYLEGDHYFFSKYVEERAHMHDIVREVFQNSKEALQTAIQDGVDYIVQTTWLTPDFSPDPSLVKLVYSTESICVYEVIS